MWWLLSAATKIKYLWFRLLAVKSCGSLADWEMFFHTCYTPTARGMAKVPRRVVKIFLGDTEVTHSQLLSAPFPQGEGRVFHLGIKQGFI